MADEPSTRSALGMLYTLAFVGGFADAGSYVLAGSFTGHLTGNTVLTAVHLMRGEWAGAARCLMAVAAFFTGTAAGTRWRAGSSSQEASVGRLWRPLALEVALFGLGLVCRGMLGMGIGGLALVACLCLALGLQNGTLQRAGMLSVHTAYMTGLSTTFAATLGAGAAGRSKRNELAAVIGSFAAGALVGGGCVARRGPAGFVLVLIPLTAALATCLFATVIEPHRSAS